MADPTLPPILYWSPSLARHLNDREGDDNVHGLIDATVATVLLATDGSGWAVLPELPADAIRLVCETRDSEPRLRGVGEQIVDCPSCTQTARICELESGCCRECSEVGRLTMHARSQTGQHPT